MRFSDEHSRNEDSSMVVIVSGMTISSNEQQPANNQLMCVSPSGRIILASDSQLMNAPSPIDFRLSGS